MLKDAPPEKLLAAIEVVARGDALIAPAVTRSVIEEFAGTVKTHAAHVLAKLGVRDRVQAVILAYEAGVVSPRR